MYVNVTPLAVDPPSAEDAKTPCVRHVCPSLPLIDTEATAPCLLRGVPCRGEWRFRRNEARLARVRHSSYNDEVTFHLRGDMMPIAVALSVCASMIACAAAGAEPSRVSTEVRTDEPAVAVGVDARSEAAAAGLCPSVGDCCQPHLGVGCEDFQCCDQVCNHTPSCCEVRWTQACADVAVAVCRVCETPFVCPQPGDCCASHIPDGGCERELCCQIVCALDSFCCDGEWDGPCVNKARANCPNICVCDSFGDFDAGTTVDLVDVASFLTCFTGAGSGPVAPGCECADYDADDDADLSDFAVFQALLAP